MKQLLTPASILLVAGGVAWAFARLQVEIVRREWDEGLSSKRDRYTRTHIRIVAAPQVERVRARRSA